MVIFLTISIWFLVDREPSLRDSLRRVWRLEKELLFYGVVVGVSFFFLDRGDTSAKLLAKSFFPVLGGVWWFCTAFAILLVLLPFLVRGLRALGRRSHLALVAVLFIFIGVLGYVPGWPLGSDDFLAVLGVAAIVPAFKWYLPVDRRAARAMLAAGIALLALRCAGVEALRVLVGIDKPFAFATGYKLPTLLVGFGAFFLAKDWDLQSPLVNGVAKSALAVYLITDYPASEKLLWERWFDLSTIAGFPFAIGRVLLILVGIYAVCTTFDWLRRRLFSVTVDRFWDGIFDRACGAASRAWSRVAASLS